MMEATRRRGQNVLGLFSHAARRIRKIPAGRSTMPTSKRKGSNEACLQFCGGDGYGGQSTRGPWKSHWQICPWPRSLYAGPGVPRSQLEMQSTMAKLARRFGPVSAMRASGSKPFRRGGVSFSRQRCRWCCRSSCVSGNLQRRNPRLRRTAGPADDAVSRSIPFFVCRKGSPSPSTMLWSSEMEGF
jgi:hypothetical protein